MMRHAITTLLLLAAPFALAGRNASGAETSPPATTEENRPDVVCGPRCVQYILKHYGQQVELHDLIQELQWPNLEAGSNLAGLQKSLNQRGIHTAAFKLPPGSQLGWTQPVIVHLKEGTTVTSGTLGHFAVWLPTSANGVAELWFGPDGVRRGTNSRFDSIRSGTVLLTYPRPIPDTSIVGETSYQERWSMYVFVIGASLLALSLIRRVV